VLETLLVLVESKGNLVTNYDLMARELFLETLRVIRSLDFLSKAARP